MSWLSGDLPQRQIGVGWAALRSLPPPAAAPSLGVAEVDAMFSEIGVVAGKGSQARRSQLIAELFSSATESEQMFLRRLLGGELRQGALAGVMADAVAKAADISGPAVRRAAMLSGDLATVAAAALTGGVSALAEFTLQVGRPVGPDARPDRLQRCRCSREARRDSYFRGQARRRPRADPPRGRHRRDLYPQPRRHHAQAPGDRRGHAGAALDRLHRRCRSHRAASRRAAAQISGNRVAIRPRAGRGGRDRSVDIEAARAAQPLSVFFFDLLSWAAPICSTARRWSALQRWTRWCLQANGSTG